MPIERNLKKNQFIIIIIFFISIILFIILLDLPIFNNFLKDNGINIYLINRLAESRIYNFIKDENKILNEVRALYTNNNQQESINSSFNISTNNTANSISSTKISINKKFLLIGDSMMQTGFGTILEKNLLQIQKVNVVREGKFSTGLNRIDYYDWYNRTQELIDANHPDYLIVYFGSNDGQQIIDKSGKVIKLYATGWEEVYRERVAEYLNKFSSQVKSIYWIGHPVPGNLDFYKKFSLFNKIYEEEILKFPNVYYINTWDRFLVNGEFSNMVADDRGVIKAVKSNDAVHVTDHGGQIMSDLVINYLKLKEIL